MWESKYSHKNQGVYRGRKNSLKQNVQRLAGSTPAPCLLERSCCGNHVLNKVDSFLQSRCRNGLSHSVMLLQPLLMELRSRSWMQSPSSSPAGLVALSEVPVFRGLCQSSLEYSQASRCVCGRNHGARVRFTPRKAWQRGNQGETLLSLTPPPTSRADSAPQETGPWEGEEEEEEARNNQPFFLGSDEAELHQGFIADSLQVDEPLGDTRFGIHHPRKSTKIDINVQEDLFVNFDNEGVARIPGGPGPVKEVKKGEIKEAEAFLDSLKIPKRFPHGSASRSIFCSRSLSLQSITTIGYDMDYTLIHYNVKPALTTYGKSAEGTGKVRFYSTSSIKRGNKYLPAWESRAYAYGMKNLRKMGYPTDGLKFDNDMVIRGLILDKEKGNLVKADRFGYVKRAMHGTKMLSNRAISELYGSELVDLRNEHRWEFLNTLFSISESVMYMQMVERLDVGALPPEVVKKDYSDIYAVVSKSLFKAHVEGQLKAEIINNPEHFIEPDPELPLALLDQKEAGKRLLLVTNSDYLYTQKMMQYAFDKYLPKGMSWRKLFDMVIVSARKPEFFQKSSPLYEIVTEDGLMRPCPKATSVMVEKALGIHGDETLYVGDHIYTDVSQSKVNLRWRTALICRELEREVKALAHGRSHRAKIIELMNEKEVVEDAFNQLRLALQRRRHYQEAQTKEATDMPERAMMDEMQKLSVLMKRLDENIVPMLEVDGKHFNQKWGYLSRAGLWDKSHLTRQIEKYADIFTSRVSNFLRYSPFMNFRSQAQVLGEYISNEHIAGIYEVLGEVQ